MQETINYRVYRKTLFSTALCMLAGMSVRRLFLIAALFIVCDTELYSQTCTGCTITVSTVDGGTYTITTGQKLCVTSTGVLNGTITLNGGTICNEGIVSPTSFTFTDGTFDNYGQLNYGGILILSNNAALNNYNSGIVKLSHSILLAPAAKYFSPASAQLVIAPCAVSVVANAGADVNISGGTPATIGGSPTASHGTAPYTYTWSPSTGLSSSTISNPVANPTTNTSYTVTVADNMGCTSSASLVVSLKTISYAVLKKKLDGGIYELNTTILYFKFDEEYKDTDGNLTYNLYNDQHQKVTGAPSQTVAYGDNRYGINFTTFSISTGYYSIEVINEKNEKWYLAFKR